MGKPEQRTLGGGSHRIVIYLGNQQLSGQGSLREKFMQFSEQEQKVIQQAHQELDDQLRRAKRHRFWGKVGVVVIVQQGVSKRPGVFCDVTIDSKEVDRGTR